MKKSFFLMNAIVAVVILFSLSACEKENTNSASAIPTATITGTLKARFDLVTSGADSLGNVPAGTKIYAKYNSKDLVVNQITASSPVYADIIKEVTVDASGNYTFTVDANLNSVSVSLYGDDFRHTLTDGGNNPSKVFALAPVTVKVTKDVIRIQDLVFRAK
jgi:hypothetical protein